MSFAPDNTPARGRKVFLVFAPLAAVLLGVSVHYADHPTPAAPGVVFAQRMDLAGVPNLGRVNETLYRGGQPTQEGLQGLKKLGVDTVVNFRHEPDRIAAERQQVESLGMRYVSIPWSGWHKPSDPQVAEFLELLHANPQRKIFAHCHHGSDRTGVMLAAYRIADQHWTAPQALAEMYAYRFHNFWMPHLRHYVEDFPHRLAADPGLRALRPAAQVSTP